MSIFAILISLLIYLSSGSITRAIYDPLSVPNNKIGIHILFTDELDQASKIVNNEGKGGWGYVTIPIQASDRNRLKWQIFLDQCKDKHVIPIIRVATAPEGANWQKPNNFDLIDFANFLGDLNWPTKNRYVIIFNEVNRSDEYGGFVSPENYADILNNAIDIFKAKSDDFFILPAGLDNAASNSKTSLNWRLYLERMYLRHPGIFDKIDGWTSHAYPNPDFSSRPDKSGSNKIDSYRSDLKFVRLFSTKKLPVFITETGWSEKYLSEHQIALYYQYVLTNQWADSNIVAITPFILNAQDGPFIVFSFKNKNGELKEFSTVLSSFATKGEPKLAVAGDTPTATSSSSNIILQTNQKSNNSLTILKKLYNNFMTLIGIFSK
ncbi:MAG TPA: hypothetical protein VLH94_01500 [Spirochaetia bacterium]|nr:hypothetical protein [Spirochaetia bacterium]